MSSVVAGKVVVADYDVLCATRTFTTSSVAATDLSGLLPNELSESSGRGAEDCIVIVVTLRTLVPACDRVDKTILERIAAEAVEVLAVALSAALGRQDALLSIRSGSSGQGSIPSCGCGLMENTLLVVRFQEWSPFCAWGDGLLLSNRHGLSGGESRDGKKKKRGESTHG